MYKLKKVLLAESNFKRAKSVGSLDDHSITIDIVPSVTDSNEFFVELIAEYRQPAQGDAEIEIKVKMVGQFETEGENEVLTLDSFSNVNAPAIIFPFVREHIASLTGKAIPNAIYIPPINFVEAYRLRQESEKQEVEESPAN